MLQLATNAALVVFAICSMLAVGLAADFDEALLPWRRGWRSVRILLANFVGVPLLAVAVATMFPLDAGMRDGLVLMGCTAGAPFALLLVRWGRANLVRTGGMVAGLLVVSLVVLPPLADLVLPDVDVDYPRVVEFLAATMVAPFGVGLLTKFRWPTVAGRLRPWAQGAANVAGGLVFVGVPLVSGAGLLSMLSSWIVPASLVFFVGAYAIGYALASGTTRRRAVTGIVTSQRNFAAASIAALANFPGDNSVLLGIAVASVVSMASMIPVAHIMRVRMGDRPAG